MENEMFPEMFPKKMRGEGRRRDFPTSQGSTCTFGKNSKQLDFYYYFFLKIR